MQPAHDPEIRSSLVHDQQEELEHLHSVPAALPLSSGRAHGLWFGALVGGAIGAVVLGLVGLLPYADLAVGWRVLITAIVGALAGGTAGAVYFGGRTPEVERETTDADGSPAIGSSPRDPSTDSRGRLRQH